MPVIDHTKRIKAEDIASVLLEWDYSKASDYDLYDALEVLGWEWDGESWNIPGYTTSLEDVLRPPQQPPADHEKDLHHPGDCTCEECNQEIDESLRELPDDWEPPEWLGNDDSPEEPYGDWTDDLIAGEWGE